MDYSFVGNNCEILHIYSHYNIEYDMPFTACHISNDLQYLDLCLNYDMYMTIEPTFKQDSGCEYPVMVVGDIEIHCYHYKTESEVVEKYKRRRERQKSKKLVFLWGDMLLYDLHSKEEHAEIKAKFLTLPNSIYLEEGVHLPFKNFDPSVTNGPTAKFVDAIYPLYIQEIDRLIG